MLSDEELVLDIVRGSESAFEALYERYQGKVYGLCMNKVRNQSAAQDVFQVVWEKVLTKIHKFDANKKFSSWLYVVSLNTIKDFFKKENNFENLLKSYKDSPGQEADELTIDIDISFLTEVEKKIIEKKYIMGSSSKEIASEMNLSDSNVRKISSRALKKLKNRYEV